MDEYERRIREMIDFHDKEMDRIYEAFMAGEGLTMRFPRAPRLEPHVKADTTKVPDTLREMVEGSK